MPELFLPRRLDAIGAACEAAETLTSEAGWAEPDRTRVALAIGEAVGNAVEHGGAPGADRIRVTLTIEGDRLDACVDDGGDGPTQDRLRRAALPNDLLATSGRGLFILQQVADDLRLDENGGLCLTIVQAGS